MGFDYDVIIVGGRVAGASSAMLLARQGHRVLLVDRVTMPADTVSTHAILRTGVLQLIRWGVLDRVVAAGTPAIREMMLGFGPERIPFQLRGEHGVEALCAPRRIVLDAVLLDAAIDAGVDFAGGTRVTGVRRDVGGRVRGVIVTRPQDTTDVTARVVIGADGVNSRIAELVGAPAYASHSPTNAVHYAYYTGVETTGFWFQFTPGINAGLIPTNDDAVCVFVGRPVHRVPAFRAEPEAEFGRLLSTAATDLAERVSAASRISPFRGTTGLPGFIKQPWGPGWALVGDAGYTKDPISAHGISNALRDAELCARAVDQTLREPSSEVDAMTQYQRMRDTLSQQIFHESKALARYGWDTQEASNRMRAISAAVRRECDAIALLPEWPSVLTPTPT